jgi:RHH-type proline utilization regulon transcriptional repressor/proline dehydrogenase/delta 1-pyrroline-5-carboxylate dehydrogenase
VTNDASTAVTLAERLLADSLADATSRERRQQQRLAGVVHDARLRSLTFALTDEVLRFDDDRRAAARFRAIVDENGVPGSLGALDRWMLRIGAVLSRPVPRLVMPMVRARIVRESNGVVLSADDPAFARHMTARRAAGFRMNVNVLGEAILSDVEADTRMRLVLERISRPDVGHVSLKISSVVANLDVLAFDLSIDRICERLRTLYRAAQGSKPATFVNLDMEEYRDLRLTLAALMRVLDEPEFASLDAGVVLQAYLPDSHEACAELGVWATRRHAAHGGTLKVRIVKGANLAMELVEAELHGWAQAPYHSKAEVDASFKRLVEAALDGRWSAAVRVGLASHNLFDIAWAMGLPARDRIEFEMLEGMATAQSRAVQQRIGDVLLYAPVVRHDDLAASIAYLTRRLDENTSPDNFLRALFTLQPGTPEWQEQARRFTDSVHGMGSLSTTGNRRQDRAETQVWQGPEFGNCPDTDWTSAANRSWVLEALAECDVVEPVLVTTEAAIDEVLERSMVAAERWAAASAAERRELLARVADEMERSRGRTLALMARTACKTITEGDPEVSEGIDFARYYAACTSAIEDGSARGLTFTPHGVVLVASPWNFPYAIPAGGVLAALAAGNAVVLKPAPEVRAVALELVAQMWRAGVPSDLVQLVACPDDEVGRHLVTHPRVDTVVLTGAYETAQMFRSWKPKLRVFAETSGKNALVVTAAADEDAAVRDLVRSAFGHAGQKCSAASLGIIEASVYDDPNFLRRLADAVGSLRVGPADDLATMMGPLVSAPSPKLLRALTTLEIGEGWLVRPTVIDEARHLWSPGVKLGVSEGSWFHRTECFGPVLGLMRARDLDHAIQLQNATEFGLTGGIHSLDEHEVARWLERAEVGNAYVNRHITGAIVQRQPFGGWKRSSVGCGPKAGGPAYVEALGNWAAPAGTVASSAQFRAVWRDHFQAEHDPSGLRSERNVLRYRPLPSLDVVVAADADPLAVAVVRLAAEVTGVAVRYVQPGEVTHSRVRVVGSVSDEQLARWHEAGIEADRVPPVADAMVELRRWVREQAISTTRHRHGRLLD